jgi:hypothetical protein
MVNMFGKKDKISGNWTDKTASHLKLLADNFVLSMKQQLNKDSIVWKDFEKSIISIVKESADLAYDDATNNSSIRDNFLSPFTSFTTVTTKTTPETRKSENLNHLENAINDLQDTLNTIKSSTTSNKKISLEDLNYIDKTLDNLQETLDILKDSKIIKKEK